MFRICYCLLLLLAAMCGNARAREPVPSLRPYADGPLTAADFAGERPADAQTAAWSEFEYKWKHAYRLETNGTSRVATLTDIDIWASVRRDKSWNLRPRSAILLDHEQGHFDIAQTQALRARLQLLKDLGKVGVPQGRGRNTDEALQALDVALAKTLTELLDPAKKAHADYDEVTKRGDLAPEQALSRKVQRAALQAIIEELEQQLE